MSTENARRIETAVLIGLPDTHAPKEQDILELASRLRSVFPIGDEDFNALLKRLHAKLAISMDTGTALLGEEELGREGALSSGMFSRVRRPRTLLFVAGREMQATVSLSF
jgi:hypothetical protein